MEETLGREGKSHWQSTKDSLVMRETIEKGKKEALIKEGGPLELGITQYTDKKENQIFLIFKEIQSGAVAKSYMRKGFLINEEMRKYFPIYEEAVSHI